MSAKSGKSSKQIDRPFDRQVLKEATAIANQYQIILVQEDGVWYGRGLELPETFDEGKTPAACVKATRQALIVTVAYMLGKGQTPPAAMTTEPRRTEQVNVRLPREERARIEATARGRGYKGMSDYIRAAALNGTS